MRALPISTHCPPAWCMTYHHAHCTEMPHWRKRHLAKCNISICLIHVLIQFSPSVVYTPSCTVRPPESCPSIQGRGMKAAPIPWMFMQTSVCIFIVILNVQCSLPYIYSILCTHLGLVIALALTYTCCTNYNLATHWPIPSPSHPALCLIDF